MKLLQMLPWLLFFFFARLLPTGRPDGLGLLRSFGPALTILIHSNTAGEKSVYASTNPGMSEGSVQALVRAGVWWCFTQNKQIHPHWLQRHKAKLWSGVASQLQLFPFQETPQWPFNRNCITWWKSLACCVLWLVGFQLADAQHWIAAIKGDQCIHTSQPSSWSLVTSEEQHASSFIRPPPWLLLLWLLLLEQMKYSSLR